jgi:hypothetical protein
LDSFGRISTFQRVTANPNKKSFPLSHCALNITNRAPLPRVLGAGPARARVRSGQQKNITQIQIFSKRIVQNFTARESSSPTVGRDVLKLGSRLRTALGWRRTFPHRAERRKCAKISYCVLNCPNRPLRSLVISSAQPRLDNRLLKLFPQNCRFAQFESHEPQRSFRSREY